MGKYTTIQIRRELYKELHEYCCDNGYTKSGLIEKLIRQRINTPKPTNVLRVGR